MLRNLILITSWILVWVILEVIVVVLVVVWGTYSAAWNARVRKGE